MKKSLLFSFSLIGQIGFAVAIPLVVFGLLGKYLDNKLNTSPYLLLVGLAIGTIIAFVTVVKIAKQAIKEFDKINRE
jgi:F0F1-type ATP synthase assembly protein I